MRIALYREPDATAELAEAVASRLRKTDGKSD
jgi:hypothetical protein